ncbi:hypothetical protein BCON_0076g00320 [Botryotinia convoluta]|uniref:Uncharacterized protein n=1 Tax=Botryotinia convoluta TaxID=54673 RepID=A0A4Z1I790_9HELO|nr:hypothetical protein BCON_0076g00320 [Botryotinia convoluta]
MSDNEFQQIHRILRPPRGNRRLDSEVDDSEVATLGLNELSADAVIAHASMVKLETAAKKSIIKSKGLQGTYASTSFHAIQQLELAG